MPMIMTEMARQETMIDFDSVPIDVLASIVELVGASSLTVVLPLTNVCRALRMATLMVRFPLTMPSSVVADPFIVLGFSTSAYFWL
jgi:hypothetical protein